MKKALVKYVATEIGQINIVSHIIENEKHLEGYKKMFPHYYPLVFKEMLKLLEQGEKIIVNKMGGYCFETEHTAILKYVD